MSTGRDEARRGEGEGEAADLFDYELIKSCLAFTWRASRRHLGLALSVFVVTAGLGIFIAQQYPKTYRVETRILASRNQVIRSLGNPRLGLPDEDPTRAAQETVFARDNLVSLIEQTDLIDQWEATRAPILKAKDWVMARIHGPISEEDKLDAMIGTLEKRIRVSSDQSTVTISIDWPHPQMAYQLVEAAQQSFLETRHVTEISAISEAISILEVHAGAVRQSMENALDELERVREARRKGLKVARAGDGQIAETAQPVDPTLPPPERPTGPTVNEQELNQLKFLIRAKRRATDDLEEFRARRLAELKAQLAEQEVQYSNQHPVILDTRQRIAALEQQSPQLLQLKHEEAELLAEYKRKGGSDPDSVLEPTPSRARSRRIDIALAMSSTDLSDDPVVEHARNQLRLAAARYEDLLMRIEAARIEHDTARAAFKYRYSVVRPASVPRRAVKPNVPLLIAASFVFAALLALSAGAAVDLWRRRLIEPWQVRRSLGLPVLAEVKRP